MLVLAVGVGANRNTMCGRRRREVVGCSIYGGYAGMLLPLGLRRLLVCHCDGICRVLWQKRLLRTGNEAKSAGKAQGRDRRRCAGAWIYL